MPGKFMGGAAFGVGGGAIAGSPAGSVDANKSSGSGVLDGG